MDLLDEKFQKISAASGPGDELKLGSTNDQDEVFSGKMIDFSHGDVDAFKPIENSLDTFIDGFHLGAKQAYTEYRGSLSIRENLAEKISQFTGTHINAENNFIITPGTQGALFLAMGSVIVPGTKVAIVMPDYVANRRIVEFLHGEVVPIYMDYLNVEGRTGIDMSELEKVLKKDVDVFVFSNPNNPTGVVYTPEEIKEIAEIGRAHV